MSAVVGTESVPGPLAPELAAALAAELVRHAEEERRLMRETRRARTPYRQSRLADCRRDHGEALKAIVGHHGWPSAEAVGEEASTAALMILLHAPDLGFQLSCRDLIARAVADGASPAVHHAYIADHCAVELGQPQFYGTRVDPGTLRPYEIRLPRSVDERRHDVGLGPLAEQMRMLRREG